MELIDGKKIAAEIKQELADEVSRMKADGKKTPHLVAVLVGNDGASETYVASKVKACREVGFKSEVIQYVKVQIEDCKEIFESTVLKNEVVDRLLYSKKDVHYKHPEDIPFMAKQTRIVLENCGRVDAESLDEYIAAAKILEPGSSRAPP